MRIEIGEDVWEWKGGPAFEPGHYVIWQGTTLEVNAFCPEGEIEVVEPVSRRVDSAAALGEHRFVAAAITYRGTTYSYGGDPGTGRFVTSSIDTVAKTIGGAFALSEFERNRDSIAVTGRLLSYY